MEEHLIQVSLFFAPFYGAGGINCFSFHMGISVEPYLVCQVFINLTGAGEKLKIVANRWVTFWSSWNGCGEVT